MGKVMLVDKLREDSLHSLLIESITLREHKFSFKLPGERLILDATPGAQVRPDWISSARCCYSTCSL